MEENASVKSQMNFQLILRGILGHSLDLFELHKLTLFFVPFMLSFKPREEHMSFSCFVMAAFCLIPMVSITVFPTTSLNMVYYNLQTHPRAFGLVASACAGQTLGIKQPWSQLRAWLPTHLRQCVPLSSQCILLSLPKFSI